MPIRSLSVVVPVWNERAALREILRRVGVAALWHILRFNLKTRRRRPPWRPAGEP